MCPFCNIRVVIALSIGLLLHAIAPSTTQAADSLPAVSGLNGKLSAQGGLYSDETTALILGSLSVPIAQQLGFQLDGAIAPLDGDAMRGGAGHLFYRNPNTFLIGAYGSFHRWRQIDIWRLALETELYLDRFSVEALVGVESISHRLKFSAPAGGPGGPITLERVDDEHVFAIADLAYYFQDNLRVSVGYRYVSEESLGAAGVEYLIGSSDGTPVSLFAEGQFGKRRYNRAMAGVRVFFGGSTGKSLMRRHREDDPRNRVPDFFAMADVCPTGRALVGNQCILPEIDEEIPE